MCGARFDICQIRPSPAAALAACERARPTERLGLPLRPAGDLPADARPRDRATAGPTASCATRWRPWATCTSQERRGGSPGASPRISSCSTRTLLGIDGFDVCRSLKAEAKYKHVPIAFVTRLSDPHYEMRTLDVGAADFIAKPCTGAILQARVRNLPDRKRRTDAELQGARSQRSRWQNWSASFGSSGSRRWIASRRSRHSFAGTCARAGTNACESISTVCDSATPPTSWRPSSIEAYACSRGLHSAHRIGGRTSACPDHAPRRGASTQYPRGSPEV